MIETQLQNNNTQHQTQKIKIIQVFSNIQNNQLEEPGNNNAQQEVEKNQIQKLEASINNSQISKPSLEEQYQQTGSSSSINQLLSSTGIPSLQYIDENESPTKQVSYPCYHCKEKINGIFYELPCLHIFHKLCLYEGVILSQMNSSPVELKCICTETIPLVSLRVLYSKYNADNLLSQIYQNQIKAIIENIKNKWTLLKCQNCEFVVIHNPKLPEGNYCPLCLMNTKNKKLN